MRRGLDSSATISAMAHIAWHGGTRCMGESWQHAFLASFPGTPLDEIKYARIVTEHLGIGATIIENRDARNLDQGRAWTLLTPYPWERAIFK